MHLKNRFSCPIRLTVWLIVLSAMCLGLASAEPSFYDNDCRSCHGAARTCDGCHMHKGSLSATADQAEYEPGEPLVVRLHGGSEGGWIRALLYDETNTEVGRANHVPFPADIAATAPMEPGVYDWEAAWYGNNNGSGHIERRTPVTITVTEPPASVEDEDEPSFLTETWGRIKNLFH